MRESLAQARHCSTIHEADWLVPSATEQAWPPWAAAVVTEYDRAFVPRPQASEQALQSPHDPTQFTGGGGGGATEIVTGAKLWFKP